MSIPDVSTRPLEELTRLTGRRAVVTGGAKGIGLATVRRMAEGGARVVIADVDVDEGEARAVELSEEFDGRVSFRKLDISDSAEVKAFADQVVADLGGIDIWVNNAGIYPAKSFLDMEDADWDKVLNINLRGSFIAAREAARRMVAKGDGGGGTIIFLVSVSGFRARSGLAHYVSSKHGVLGLVRNLAVELAPHNIRVLGVAPTVVSTPGVAAARQSNAGDGAAAYEAFLQQTIAGLPLGRISVADDIARVVYFCATDMATYMTGTVLMAEGGVTA